MLFSTSWCCLRGCRTLSMCDWHHSLMLHRLLSGLPRCEQPPKHAPTTRAELPQPGPPVLMKENHKSKHPFSTQEGRCQRGGRPFSWFRDYVEMAASFLARQSHMLHFIYCIYLLWIFLEHHLVSKNTSKKSAYPKLLFLIPNASTVLGLQEATM